MCTHSEWGAVPLPGTLHTPGVPLPAGSGALHPARSMWRRTGHAVGARGASSHLLPLHRPPGGSSCHTAHSTVSRVLCPRGQQMTPGGSPQPGPSGSSGNNPRCGPQDGTALNSLVWGLALRAPTRRPRPLRPSFRPPRGDFAQVGRQDPPHQDPGRPRTSLTRPSRAAGAGLPGSAR